MLWWVCAQVDTAKRGESVAMKVEATNSTEATRLYGRHFDHKARRLPLLRHHHCTHWHGRHARVTSLG